MAIDIKSVFAEWKAVTIEKTKLVLQQQSMYVVHAQTLLM
jgi:hypothetical protein